MDSFATTVSVAIQYGVPLRDLVNKFAHVRFEPSGFTGNSEIPIAKSIVDYIFRWLGSRFLSTDDKASLGLIDRSASVDSPVAPVSGTGPLATAPPASFARDTLADPAPATVEPESAADSRPADPPKASAVVADRESAPSASVGFAEPAPRAE